MSSNVCFDTFFATYQSHGVAGPPPVNRRYQKKKKKKQEKENKQQPKKKRQQQQLLKPAIFFATAGVYLSTTQATAARKATRPSFTAFALQARSSVSSSTSGPTFEAPKSCEAGEKTAKCWKGKWV